jgi:hypothetical protein
MSYELLFDGDPEEDSKYLAGLVDVETLAPERTAKGNGDPRNSKRRQDLVGPNATL